MAHAKIHTVSTTEELRSVIEKSLPGDIIELEDGEYQIENIHGFIIRDKYNLTIRGKSGIREAVILKGKGMDGKVQFIFKLYRALYFTLSDLTMKDVYWHHIQINEGSSHFSLRNLVMVDAGEAPVKVTSAGGDGPFADNGLIENCWIGFTDYGTRENVEGIDIIASSGTVVRNCEFYRVRTMEGAEGVGWGVFAKCNAENTVIENNYFEDNDIAISFGNGGCPSKYARSNNITYQHRGGIIKNNVVNRTRDTAIFINSAKDFKIYNNTLWSTFQDGGSSIDVRFNSNGRIVNNISSQNYRLRDGGQAAISANIWFAAPSLFVDQPKGDFHLASNTTKAIDKGSDISADVSQDIDGQKRPTGSGLDIGAYERKY